MISQTSSASWPVAQVRNLAPHARDDWKPAKDSCLRKKSAIESIGRVARYMLEVPHTHLARPRRAAAQADRGPYGGSRERSHEIAERSHRVV